MKASTCSLFVVLLLGCTAPEEPKQTEAPVQPQPSGNFQLPVSLNEVMVALVNDAADPLWVAAWASPETDAEWRELERRAYQLELAGALIRFPGNGPLDHQWTAKPAWSSWSDQLRDVGGDAVKAAQNRDLSKIADVGDRTVEICEGCHADFKLSFPTRGQFGELSPNEADLDRQ